MRGRPIRLQHDARQYTLRDSGCGPCCWECAKDSCAVTVSDAEAAEARHTLVRARVYAEASSATVLAATARLRSQGWIGVEDRVVLVITSRGFKGSQIDG